MKLIANTLVCCGYAVVPVAAILYLAGKEDWAGKCAFVGFVFWFSGVGLGFRLKEIDEIRKSSDEPYFPEKQISD